MNLVEKVVTVALRDAPLVPAAWGRMVGVPVVVTGRIKEQTAEGLYLEPIDVVHLNNGSKAEREAGEIPFAGIFVPWRSVSSVAVH
jgi:hypothetical protein